MEEHTSKLIDLLVNNKKKKKSEDATLDLKNNLLEILEILINRESNLESHYCQDLKTLLIDFFNLYTILSINIKLYHCNNIERDIRHLLDTLIDNVIDRTHTINNTDVTKVLTLVKEKKEKLEFINVEKLT